MNCSKWVPEGNNPDVVQRQPGTITPLQALGVGHISFGIDNWNAERVRAELIERDVVYVINGPGRAAGG